jgi:hypothetical protein
VTSSSPARDRADGRQGPGVPASFDSEYLAHRWPRLFHMAEAGSWRSIATHGLLSTTALLDRFEVRGSARIALEARRRPEATEIRHRRHGRAWIRDNKPINEAALERTLVGMTAPEWYRTLNGRVFFWLTTDRLAALRNARANRGRRHDVLTLDTAALLGRHDGAVELSPLNSGAVHHGASYVRGVGTFRSIEAYPWQERMRRAPREPVVELTVPYAVPDITGLVIDVETI